MWRGCVLAAILVLPVDAAAMAGPIVWSLKKPTRNTVGSAPWHIPAPAPADPATAKTMPDIAGPAVRSASSPPQDFSIAPSVSNIFNRRNDLSEDQMGAEGSPNAYLRSVGRTFGLALKKSLY